MSIPFRLAGAALAAATTLPTPPAVAAESASPWVVALLGAWAAVGLLAAAGLGAFRRRGIAGPERLAADDSAWELLATLGGGVVALVLGLWVATAAVHLGRRADPAHPPGDLVQLAIGGFGEAAAVATVLALVRRRRPRGDGLRLMGLNPARLPTAVAGGTAALFVLFPLIQLAGLAVIWVYQRLGLTPAQPHQLLRMMSADHKWAVAVAGVLTAAVVAPVAEEVAFRGLMQTALGRLFNWTADRLGLSTPGAALPPPGSAGADPLPPEPVRLSYAGPETPAATVHTRPVARWAAVVVTSMAFAAVHGEPAFLAPIFVLSVGLGFVYERSGNLWMTIVTHGLFNGAQIAFYLAGNG